MAKIQAVKEVKKELGWKVGTATVRLNGLSPILMNTPQSMSISGTDKKKMSAQDQASLTRYLTEDGEYLAIPADAIYRCVVNGSKGLKHGRAPMVTIVSGCLQIEPRMIPILRGGERIGAEDYQVDARRVVRQRQAIICYRACIDIPWELVFELSWDDGVMRFEVFGESYLPQILATAGRLYGLLDYRPERKGSFGRFEPTGIG